MDYYEKMYRALIKMVVLDGTEHLCSSSYRDAASRATARNVFIGEIASKVLDNTPEINDGEYQRLYNDLEQS